MPRHSSFTIMQDFAKRGRVRHNMAASLGNTTVWTTKVQGNKAEQWEKLGEILSSKRLLRDDSAYSLQQKMLNVNVTIIYNL